MCRFVAALDYAGMDSNHVQLDSYFTPLLLVVLVFYIKLESPNYRCQVGTWTIRYWALECLRLQIRA